MPIHTFDTFIRSFNICFNLLYDDMVALIIFLVIVWLYALGLGKQESEDNQEWEAERKYWQDYFKDE